MDLYDAYMAGYEDGMTKVAMDEETKNIAKGALAAGALGAAGYGAHRYFNFGVDPTQSALADVKNIGKAGIRKGFAGAAAVGDAYDSAAQTISELRGKDKGIKAALKALGQKNTFLNRLKYMSK